MLSPVMEQDTYDIGQPIADLGESDKFQEWVRAVGKIQDKEGTWKTKRLSQTQTL